MYPKFTPATAESFFLGIFNGARFSVVTSRRSGFDGFEKYTPLPCLHLTVTADDEAVTWDIWKQRGGSIGTVIDAAKLRQEEIVRHFFGDSLAAEDVATRVELNDHNSARRQTVHFQLEVGHKDLFGEKGFVRQNVQSLLRSELIAEEAIAENEALKRALS